MKDGSIEPVFCHLIASRSVPAPAFDGFEQWRTSFTELCASWPHPIDRAIVGGFESDRIGYAFAAGIQAALRALFPGLPETSFASVCITEEGGGHPRAIETTITAGGDGTWRIDGRKKWSTLATRADVLLVAAVRGVADDGTRDIVLVRVDRRAPGVTVEPMEPTPFAPEIEHARVELREVVVPDSAILPGDGYRDYVKPFRTIEDTFVSAALAALLLRTAAACGWGDDLKARLLTVLVALYGLAGAEPSDPATHILLDAAQHELAALADPQEPWWDAVPAAVRERWQRDVGLMQVASTVRAKRLERARAALSS